jgi:hypothetical protein
MGKKESNPRPPKGIKRPTPPPHPPKLKYIPDGYLDGIMNSAFPKISTYHNASCLKCNSVFEEMIRVGCLIFCTNCAYSIFKTENPVKEEPEEYKKWLEIYKNKGE